MRLPVHVITIGVMLLIAGIAQQRTTPELVSRPPLGLPVNNGYPSLARSADGALWLAWVSNREFDRGKRGTEADHTRADHIMLKRKSGQTWSQEIRLSTGHSMNADPTVVGDTDGAWIFWAMRDKGEWGIYSRHIDTKLQLSEVKRLTPSPGPDAAPHAAAGPDGTIWLAWEAFRAGVNQVYAMHGKDGRFSPPEAVSPAAKPSYQPQVTVAANGTASLAWDGGAAERYRVFLRQWKNGAWSDVQAAPTDASLDAYAPGIAAGRGDSVWLAYAQNPERAPEWGIRGWRPGPMPRPRVLGLQWTGTAWRDSGLRAVNADMPVVVADAAGGVQVLMMQLVGHMNFRLMRSAFGKDGWSQPRHLDENEELYQAVRYAGVQGVRVDQRPSAVVSNGRVVLAYERGTGVFENRQIAVREFEAAGPAPDAAALYPSIAAPGTMREIPPKPASPQVKGYGVYFGELHMHLLMDDGHTGSADQYYTFARDRWHLDFAAYTPHAESNKLLASEVGMVQRVAAMFNQPGRFVGISGWEWTQGDFRVPQEGHKHVINETDDQPFFSATEATSDSARELTARMKGTKGIMFAHHIARGAAGGTNFDAIDTSVEPDMEIASHWGRFEFYRNPGYTRDEIRGSSLQEAWKRALKIGVVGGSDNHDLYMERPSALTAVLAEKLDRHSIFQALRARRCYATTGEKIVLDVRVNGQPMGSTLKASRTPVVTVFARGTANLEKVELIKFYKGVAEPFPAVYTVTPEALEASFEWRDMDFRADSAYYVRVTQRSEPRITGKQNFGSATSFPNEMAWSSPIWVIKK